MLQVFKPLPVVRDVHRMDAIPAMAAHFRRDSLTLGWEERLRARGRRRTDGGTEFGTALPRGTVLRDGDGLIVPDLSLLVQIVERPEPVFVIVPESPAEWAAFGYHIGNSHQPLMIADDVLVCPEVAGMEQILCYHRIPFTRDRRPFTPVGLGGDLTGAGHQHAPPGGFPGSTR